MPQEIQGNIFGRLGTALGKGLSETVPKEIEHYRLRSGLKNLADEADNGNLSPSQFLAKAAGTYGISPQMVQSFGQLSQQQARGQALIQSQQEQTKQQQQQALEKFSNPNASPVPQKQSQEAPSVTKGRHLEEIQKGYIPPTLEERRQTAGDRYRQSPARYNNDPQMALDEVDKEVAINQERNAAHEQQHKRLTETQDNAVNRLKAHASEKLGLKNIPANVYSDIEDEFIEDIRPKSEGGRGLTEQEAIKKRGKELEDIDRDYVELASVGNWGVNSRKSSDTLFSLKAIQKKMAKRGDTENMADTLVTKNNLSPSKAYAVSQPIYDTPELNEIFKNLKPYKGDSNVEFEKGKESFSLDRLNKIIENQLDFKMNASVPSLDASESADVKDLKLHKKLLKSLGKEGSPLAVGYELKRLGYNPDSWMNFLLKNSDDLTVKQMRQLEKSNSYFGTLNDMWLDAFTGVE